MSAEKGKNPYKSLWTDGPRKDMGITGNKGNIFEPGESRTQDLWIGPF